MPGINKWKDDAEDLIVYKEENIKALNVIGRNVYDLEKQAIMNLKNKMEEGEGNTNKSLMH